MPDVIINNIDLWTSALLTKSTVGRGSNGKVEAYGIKKLRELILELAVRGKLVQQDPNDEPASVLLEEIASEKLRLVKSGKIKKLNELHEIDNEDIPFFIPQGWEWERLGNLTTQITDGTHHTPTYMDQGVPFISVKDIDGNTVSFEDCKYISQKQHEDINSRCNPEFGDLLICRIGTLGRATIVDTHEPFSLFVSVGLIKFLQHLLIPKFVRLVLHSPLLTNQYEEIKAGGSHTNKLNLGDIPKLLIPVAPLAEQHRIVAKVDELMALCDQLEQQQTTGIEAHQILVETLLGTLTGAASPEEFAEAWTRIANHFDTLFTTEQSIDQLRQTVLQLAVMGKLVPQNPNDEPASVLLERIAKEKTRLITSGKLKNKKESPQTKEAASPFQLPSGWTWARLPEIGELARGKSKHRPRNDPKLYTDGTIPMVQTGDVSRANPVISSYTALYNQTGVNQSRLWPKDTMCITIAANIAESGILGFDACFPDSIVGFIPFEANLSIKYFEYFIRTAKSRLEDYAPSTAQKNINLDILGQLLVPLPPAKELNNIVAKVDELMALCDTIKARFIAAQTSQIHLADAIVEQAVA